VSDSTRARYCHWQLAELLNRHPGLRISPSANDRLILKGDVSFRLQGPSHEPIGDSYIVELQIPQRFPEELPSARELGDRIPAWFHKFEGVWLCLGAPTALRLRLSQSRTLTTYVDDFVVPYLFGYSYFARHGEMPFGELAHGSPGILDYLAELFGSEQRQDAHEFLRLASLKKREANKCACPCRSGLRLGRCHHRRVSSLREELGRKWFRDEHRTVIRQL